MTTKDIWREIQRIVGTTDDGKPGRLTAQAVLAKIAPTVHHESTGAPFIDRLVEIAAREVGVREVPVDSNRGPRVEIYQSATWLSGTGWPWCAAFVCWVIREAMRGEKFQWKRPETASAWDFERWARDQPGGVKCLPGSTPVKRGDILVYTFSHIGIAEEDMRGGLVETILARPFGVRAGGVYRQTRAKEQIRSIVRFDSLSP